MGIFKKLAIGTIIGLVFLFLWFQFLDLNAVWDVIKNANIIYFFLAFIPVIVAVVFRCLRWKLILDDFVKIDFWMVFRIYVAGLFFSFLIPVRAGEVLRTVIIKDKYKVRISNTIHTVVIDKFFDMVALAICLLFLPLFFTHESQLFNIMYSVLVLGVLLLLIGIILIKVRKDFVIWIIDNFPFIPQLLRKSFVRIVQQIYDTNLSFQKSVWYLVLSLLADFCEGFTIYFLFVAIGVKIPVFFAILGYCMYLLVYMVPGAPGQIGTPQLVLLMIFSTLGSIGVNSVNSLAILLYLVGISLMTIYGFVSIISLNLSVKRMFRAIVK